MSASSECWVHRQAIDVTDTVGDRPSDDASQSVFLERAEPGQRYAAHVVDGFEKRRNPVEADPVSLDPICGSLDLDYSYGHRDVVQIDRSQHHGGRSPHARVGGRNPGIAKSSRRRMAAGINPVGE